MYFRVTLCLYVNGEVVCSLDISINYQQKTLTYNCGPWGCLDGAFKVQADQYTIQM